MFSTITEISWIGVLVATVINFFLGGLWFGFLFAKPYAFALGRENMPKQKLAPIYLIGPLICGLMTTLTLATFLVILKVETLVGACGFGALVGIGFLASTTLNTAINPNIPRPLVYGLVSGSFFCISSVFVSIVLFIFM